MYVWILSLPIVDADGVNLWSYHPAFRNAITEQGPSSCHVCDDADRKQVGFSTVVNMQMVFTDTHRPSMGGTTSTVVRNNPFHHQHFHTMFFKRSSSSCRPYAIPTTGPDHIQRLNCATAHSQCLLPHYHVHVPPHAGHQLNAKEFRYLRTVRIQPPFTGS